MRCADAPKVAAVSGFCGETAALPLTVTALDAVAAEVIIECAAIVPSSIVPISRTAVKALRPGRRITKREETPFICPPTFRT